MAKARKSFDKELMYKKIMPTNLKKNNDADLEGIIHDSSNDEIFQKENLISINAKAVYLNERSHEIEKLTEIEEKCKIDEPKEIEEKLYSKETFEVEEETEAEIEKQEEKEEDLNNIEEQIEPEKEENGVIVYNVIEELVMEKLDITLQKMNCCKCDRCKVDIVALALNSLKPVYIVGTKEEIEMKKDEYKKLGLEVTTAVLKAVLTVRRNPRH